MRETKNLIEEYLMYQKGLGLLWLWMDMWADLSGWSWDSENSTLSLSNLSSQRFLLGMPKPAFSKRTKNKNCFLGVQEDEYIWMGRIKWQKIIWDKKIEKLWFVSQFINSPVEQWPDIPSMALGIHVDKDKLEGWSGKKMDWRKIWWDEKGNIHINLSFNGSYNFFEGSLEEFWSMEERNNIRTLEDIILDEISHSNIYHEPEYKGGAVPLSKEQKEMATPFKEKNKTSNIEEKFPNLFGQFLDK